MSMERKQLERELRTHFNWQEWIPVYGLVKSVANERLHEHRGVFSSVGRHERVNFEILALRYGIQTFHFSYQVASLVGTLYLLAR